MKNFIITNHPHLGFPLAAKQKDRRVMGNIYENKDLLNNNDKI